MVKPITVVSLGPGRREYLTLWAIDEMKKAERLFLRTGLCDAAAYLKESGIAFETMDALHESCEDFDELKDAIARRLLAAAEKQEICYAVFDASADETVAALRERAAIQCLPGMPLCAPFLAAAPEGRIEVQTASALEVTGTRSAPRCALRARSASCNCWIGTLWSSRCAFSRPVRRRHVPLSSCRFQNSTARKVTTIPAR